MNAAIGLEHKVGATQGMAGLFVGVLTVSILSHTSPPHPLNPLQHDYD